MPIKLSLDGTWEVRAESVDCIGEQGCSLVVAKSEDWIPAQVPGEIHLDLIRAGRMPEPSVGHNAPDCRWPETHSWWYRTTSIVSEQLLLCERQELVFDGLDLYAQVFVNGHLIGSSANAFVPAIFDVKRFLHEGVNDLVVRITAGNELAAYDGESGRDGAATPGAIPNPEQVNGGFSTQGPWPIPYGHRTWSGTKRLRKPQYCYGWDWADALPNIGIWRGVRIEGQSYAAIGDLRLDTVIRGEQVSLELEAVVENLDTWLERAAVLLLDIAPPGEAQPIASRRYELDLQPGRVPVRDLIDVPHPQLWWPNAMGDQPLYKVSVRLEDVSGNVCAERSFFIGLRTVSIDRSRLSEGTRFCVRVNGQDVFCRGGNIGPHDMILARVSDAKYEALVDEARNANMNMLRINGCSIYEAPAFYDACDRAGILVWQDFMFTCTAYPEDDPAFVAGVRSEVESALKLLRHHPSIAVWCGNNEIAALLLGGPKLFNQLIPDICRLQDPYRPYWPSSPIGGGDDPQNETSGDCHWWGPAYMNADVTRRIRPEVYDECRSRFVSEYGVIGPCHMDTIHEYLQPGEIDFDNISWRVHTNVAEGGNVKAGIAYHYIDTDPLSMQEFVHYGQMFQAIVHGNAMEALRFRKNDPVDDCQGALIWSFSDCWGETGWSILDHYLRRKASYYWFKRASRPTKIIVRQRGQRLMTRLVNDTMRGFTATVRTGWWRTDGNGQEVSDTAVNVAPNSMLEVSGAPVPAASERDPRQWVYGAVLIDNNGGAIDQSIRTLLPHRELMLVKPEIVVEKCADRDLDVVSSVYCHAARIEDHGKEVLSDNWFDLLPEVPVRVRPAYGVDISTLHFEAIGGAA